VAARAGVAGATGAAGAAGAAGRAAQPASTQAAAIRRSRFMRRRIHGLVGSCAVPARSKERTLRLVSKRAQKKRQVLFIHGGGRGAYAADSKLAAKLAESLGPDYVVRCPKLPKEASPDYDVWKRRILEELARMGAGAFVVGHSIGASVVIRVAADGALDRSLAGLFLASTPFWYDHEVWKWKEVELPNDAAARLPRGVPLFLYHGREDEVVPFAHLGKYAKALPGAVVCRLAGRDHQLNEDLTEVARDIRRCAEKRSSGRTRRS
jgi:uncharacterized protein